MGGQPLRNAVAPVLAVLAIVGLLVGAALGGREAGSSPRARSTSLPVTSTTLVCPDVGGTLRAQTSSTTDLADVSGSLSPPSTPRGQVTIRTLSTGATPRTVALGASVAVPGRPANGPALSLQITGSGAASSVADQVAVTAGGRFHGMSGSRCEPPALDWWFAGADGRVGFSDTLMIANPGVLATSVAVSLTSAGGVIAPPSLGDVQVPAGSRVLVQIPQVAPNAATVAVHVHALGGAVVAALIDRRTSGVTPRGVDWLPATHAPSRRLVVSGYPAGPGRRELVLANAGGTAAEVTVRLVTTGGTFTPTSGAQVSVLADRTTVVDLTTSMNGMAAAAVVTSTAAVTAEGRTVSYDGTLAPDEAFLPATDPLESLGAVADATDPDGGPTLLELTAPQGATSVMVSSPGGRSQTIAVAAGHSVETNVTGLLARGSAAALVVTPLGRAPVYATRLLTFNGLHGALITAEPVLPLPQATRLPAARLVEDCGHS